jgi:hypothetical protein
MQFGGKHVPHIGHRKALPAGRRHRRRIPHLVKRHAQGYPFEAPEAGPIMRNGNTDASANLVPAVAAWHARGQLPDRAPRKKATPKQRTTGGYQSIPLEDAFTREMPKSHQGLVFTSFVFSV